MTLSVPGAIAPSLSAICLLLALGASVEGAFAQSQEIKVSGMGIRKCAEWQQWKDTGNAESRAMTLEWARGFMAGTTSSAAPPAARQRLSRQESAC